ncbi:malate dehydrogenase [Yersinia rohdei]|uniref:NAD-dependent malic enzyme n=1 Tax=Yersinia rohdei TaxID=29485 RepID=UPI0005DF5F4A|nr:NAD-dependent malic enzyme [Yersinia rohdei]MDN0093121.1 NAD-dependent malic enzyme [Yersinia rohdei]CNE34689.1 malate dehydrogenase [Yersinia rohdei]CNJ04470.1 malate dehydrogenase [Yersinia rohdei]CQJ48255.1 malate dehydrogenase [Yersinia rohdei]
MRQAKVIVENGKRKIQTTARGYNVLRDPSLNKGSSFTKEERERLGLNGILPPVITSDMEVQLNRSYNVYHSHKSDLEKHVYMWQLHDNNSTLFYALLQRHMLEMLPVVYDPVVGDAIENYSEIETRPRGIFISINEPELIEEKLRAFGAQPEEIRLLVTTDAEEILGIGDWGSNGIDISVGKLAVYTAAAGVDPHSVIPVVLDVGTNNEKLLNDPAYVGNRHERITGQVYDDFIDSYVKAVRNIYPEAVLHWEDFGSTNARRIINKYRDNFATFNDDMQGTGAIVLAGLLNAVKLSKTPWTEQRVVIFGSGTAGCGIADQIRDQMMKSGLSKEEAISRIWLVDLPGLITSDMTDDLLFYQRDYAKNIADVSSYPRTKVDISVESRTRFPEMASILIKQNSDKGIIDLAAVVNKVKPTVLIGTSTTPGAFTESIVRDMASNVERPIIFPLSNPTLLHEATPQHLIEWTDGKVFTATGAPFDDVNYKGITYKIGQANNAALYPGLGFGAIVSKASKITDEMIFAAVEAVASQATLGAEGASLLPSNADLRVTSSIVALNVLRTAQSQGLSKVDTNQSDVELVREAAWWPVYVPVEAV